MDSLRLADAEREAALARLGEHYALGRLDKDEFDERSDAIWSARTRGDLLPVFADLESPVESAHGYRPLRPGLPDVRRHRHGAFPFPVVPLVVGLIILSALTHFPVILFGLFAWCLLRFRPRTR